MNEAIRAKARISGGAALSVENIPEGVKQFIIRNIESVAHVEALLLLRSGCDREWGVEEVAQRLYIDGDKAANVLSDLCSRRLVSVEKGQSARYRYSPATASMDQAVAELSEAYRKRLVAVTNFIYSRPSTSIQRFADAFKLRKEE